MRIDGRIFWVADDPALLAAQVAGQDIDPHPPLRFGVSTDDMISGAACTLGYSEAILGPHFLARLAPGVSSGGFTVLVGGEAYGSGSSREVAVTAHRGAGIELVVAKSLQRIFQENMVYAGLPFTTDLTVVDRILAGEDIDLEAISADLPPFFQSVAERGGLLQYAQDLLAGRVAPPRTEAASGPSTAVEKIIARRVYQGADAPLGVPSVAPGDQLLVRAGFRGLHEYTAGMVMHLFQEGFDRAPIDDPDSVACFEDHFVLLGDETVPLPVRSARLDPARKLAAEMVAACKTYGIRLFGPGRDHPAGICHRIVLERYAEPGEIVILTDSHSPTAGAIGAFGFGVGSTAMAFALRTGLIPVTVPRTVRIDVFGEPGDFVAPKDLMLHVLGDPWFREERWRNHPADTCVLEWGGPALERWDVDELSVLTNMTVEGGLMSGIVIPSAPAAAFLSAHRGRSDFAPVGPDEGASYARRLRIDLAEVPLTVATPGDPRNRSSLENHVGEPVHNVVIASCTGASLSDLQAAAQLLEGRQVAPGVRLTVTPASAEVEADAERMGLLEVFRAAGALVTSPGCGACIGNGPGIPEPGETTASTTNRNFDGRMGAPGPVYLVSPAVAAATARTGVLTDPRSLISSIRSLVGG